MIYKWVRELIQKFSFIDSTELKHGYVYLYYENKGVKRFKRVPLRGNRDLVLNALEKIKTEIRYFETREERNKRVLEEIEKEERPAFVVG